MNIVFTDDFFRDGKDKHRFEETDTLKGPSNDYPSNREMPPQNEDPWGTPWPAIPGGGEPDHIPLPGEGGGECLCDESENVMGYYIPWHFMLEKHHFEKKKGFKGSVDDINNSLPECRQWGIHLCMDNIINYVDSSLMPQVSPHLSGPKEVKYYRDYAVYLQVMKTLAHEWGHYRAEVLALEQMEGLTSIMDEYGVIQYSGNYLKYFRSTASKSNDFEEVFAEWCALRLGVYNTKMIRPDDLPSVFPARKDQITKDWLIRIGLLGSMKSNMAPYGDVARWVDFDELESSQLLDDYITGKTNLSRAIGRYTFTGAFKIIDHVMHNINCYSKENVGSKRYAPVTSRGRSLYGEAASIRPGIGLELNPQSASYDPDLYGSKRRTSRALFLEKPLVLDSFKQDIYRLPLENFSVLPVRVYH